MTTLDIDLPSHVEVCVGCGLVLQAQARLFVWYARLGVVCQCDVVRVWRCRHSLSHDVIFQVNGYGQSINTVMNIISR